jgi:hypothetical protein
MGAWGVGTFENDDACDYAAEVASNSSLSRIEASLDRVQKAGGALLEAPEAAEALAAADIVARLKGNFGKRDAYTEAIDKWVLQIKLTPSNDLVEKAQQAIHRVLREPSELLELWGESAELEAWKSAVNEVLSRL